MRLQRAKCRVVDFSATVKKRFSTIGEFFARVKQVWLSCVSVQSNFGR